jgi:intein/homing endonuclease
MLQYIAGFFDADGSIGVSRFHSNETKQLAVSFTNTDLNILEKIRDYFAERGVKGWIIKVKKREDHYLQGYQLAFYRNAAIQVMLDMGSFVLHHKKVERFKLFQKEYRPLIKRNGKYSEKEREQLEAVAQRIIDIKV